MAIRNCINIIIINRKFIFCVMFQLGACRKLLEQTKTNFKFFVGMKCFDHNMHAFGWITWFRAHLLQAIYWETSVGNTKAELGSRRNFTFCNRRKENRQWDRRKYSWWNRWMIRETQLRVDEYWYQNLTGVIIPLISLIFTQIGFKIPYCSVSINTILNKWTSIQFASAQKYRIEKDACGHCNPNIRVSSNRLPHEPITNFLY